MLIDAQNRPSNAQAVAGTGALVSTDSIDLLSAGRNIGRSHPMRAVAVLTTALAGGTSIQAHLIESNDSTLATGQTVLASGPVTLTAAGTLGAEILDVPIPDTSKRYLGFRFDRVGTFTTGNVTAALVGSTDNPATKIPMNTGL